MTTRLAVIVAASACLLLAGAPAHAQQAENSAAPVRNELVGPPQLKDFTLNGTVTRAAPAPTSRPPAQQQQRQSAPSTKTVEGQTRTAPATATARTQTSVDRQVQSRSPAPAASKALAPTVDLPANPAPVASSNVEPQSDQAPPPPAPAAPSVEDSSAIAILPWIIAALAIAGALGWFLVRQRPRERLAGAATFDLFDAPAQPAAAPGNPALSAAEPAQPKPVASGTVSTRLRPWIELEIEPGRAIVDDQKAALEFHVSVLNSGSVPARNVLVEASLFNAGPHQDQQIRAFFDKPVGEGKSIEVIPPMKRISIRSAVVLPREQVQALEFEGRALFVPLIAFNALYSWGGGRGQTSASYLIGKQTGGEKLAPLRLDLGPRLFRNLLAREHELSLRT